MLEVPGETRLPPWWLVTGISPFSDRVTSRPTSLGLGLVIVREDFLVPNGDFPRVFFPFRVLATPYKGGYSIE